MKITIEVPEEVSNRIQNGKANEYDRYYLVGAVIQGIERPIGNWVMVSPARIYSCSKCGQNVRTDNIECYKFCHGCGAEMGVCV